MLRERPLKFPQSSSSRLPRLISVLVILALLLLVLDQAGMLGPVRNQAISLITPILTRINQAGWSLNGIGQELSVPGQLHATITAQNEQISQLRAQEIENQSLKLQIARLNEQLRIEQERPWQLIGAEVSARSPDTGRRTLILAVGADQGVQPGMAVIGREGGSPPSLIGVVESVGPRSASVLLITDFSSAVSARINTETDTIAGIVQGQWQRGSRLLLQEIAREVLLNAGDVVVTAGMTARMNSDLPRAAIPENVPIGMIEAIRVAGYGQEADLRPFVDPDRVRYAWVILKTDA